MIVGSGTDCVSYIIITINLHAKDPNLAVKINNELHTYV